jgi:hypothetical protein
MSWPISTTVRQPQFLHRSNSNALRPFRSPSVRSPIDRTKFVRRLVIGNSANRNSEINFGMTKLTPFPGGEHPTMGRGGVSSTLEWAWLTSASSSCKVLYPQFFCQTKSSSLHPCRSPSTRIFALRRTLASRTDVSMHSIALPRRSSGMWIGLGKELKIKAVILISKMTCESAFSLP